MKKVVVLTGSGISAESGIPTFRDAGGVWDQYDITEVASPEGWRRNPKLVLDFYNQRRKKALEAKPNKGHVVLAELEEHFDITVITQNIDTLHEKAGSRDVIHLHGNIFESRSTLDPTLVYEIKGWELNLGDKCEKGSQLRPNIVWFGEMVPMMEIAAEVTSSADLFVVAGTSMVVYPAAGLIDMVGSFTPKFLVDPTPAVEGGYQNLTVIPEKATTGMVKLRNLLLDQK